MRSALRIKGIVVATLSLCAAVQAAETIEFRLDDSWGREVRSQDYRGRPILLEFGACW